MWRLARTSAGASKRGPRRASAAEETLRFANATARRLAAVSSVARALPWEEATMQSRLGFARLLPLAVRTGLAAGTLVLLPCVRPVQAPEPVHRCASYLDQIRQIREDGGCSDVPAPVPARGIVDAHGRA